MQFYLQTKPFLNSNWKKKNHFKKKGEKGRGRCFGLVAEASPAR
jgi:hypothetical protein